jgi:hypothetical protein
MTYLVFEYISAMVILVAMQHSHVCVIVARQTPSKVRVAFTSKLQSSRQEVV